MKFVARTLGPTAKTAARDFAALVLTGPRRAGKTALLRRLFPNAHYALMEDPDAIAAIRSDPRGFLDALRLPALLDEIQNAPELFGYIRSRIDARPRERGQWLLTGSQEAPLMQGVTESMAGRAAVLQLAPFSVAETERATLLHGGFPEVVARPAARELWFSSYIQTYLERDVRAVLNVRDLPTFRRFLGLLAARHGQQLNKTAIAAPLGVSVPTLTEWLHVLEVTGQILLVPPYFENLGKRLTKTPKLYWADSGLACHLLGIRTQAELERSPFLGAVFEGFVATEIVKSQIHHGLRKEIYHFRDEQGLEVDFLFPGTAGQWRAVEAKASRTALPAMAKPLAQLRTAMEGREARFTVVHRKGSTAPPTRSLAPGIEALDLAAFSAGLQRPQRKG